MIITTTPRLDHGQCCRFVNHLSGLTPNISFLWMSVYRVAVRANEIFNRPTRRSVVSSSSVPSLTSRSTVTQSARRSALLARAARPVPSTFPRSPSWSLSFVSRGMSYLSNQRNSNTNGFAVSTRLLPSPARSYNCCVFSRSTMVSLSA